MRIALLTDGITPYVTGGMQRHSFNLCRYFAQQKIHVDLYHCDPENRGAQALNCFTPEEKEYIRSELIVFPDFGKIPGHYIKESYEYSRRVYSQLRKNADVDFIYAKGFTGWELLNQKSRGLSIAPVGVNFHGYEMFQRQPDIKNLISAKLLLRSPVRFNIKHADYLFSYGGKITEILLREGVSRNKIIELPAAIGSEWLVNVAKEVHHPVRFLFVGRDERRKGIKELSAALRSFDQAERKKFIFEFVGPITPANKIAGCTYHGELSNPSELRSVYAGADVLIVPSYSEGMPNVILEAMGAGMAIIASDVGAVRCMVSDDNGWILSDVSARDIANLLKKVVSAGDKEVYHRKTKSLLKAAELTWDKIGDATLKVIVGLIG
jgi:glycosyltransferase involved in cell wall biosynthesis